MYCQGEKDEIVIKRKSERKLKGNLEMKLGTLFARANARLDRHETMRMGRKLGVASPSGGLVRSSYNVA